MNSSRVVETTIGNPGDPIEFYLSVIPAIVTMMVAVYIVYIVMNRIAPRLLRVIVRLGSFMISSGLIVASTIYLYFGINESRDSWVGMGLLFLLLGIAALYSWGRSNNSKGEMSHGQQVQEIPVVGSDYATFLRDESSRPHGITRRFDG